MEQRNLLPRATPGIKDSFGLQSHKSKSFIHAPRDLAVQKLRRR
jgi:hypothetical protein